MIQADTAAMQERFCKVIKEMVAFSAETSPNALDPWEPYFQMEREASELAYTLGGRDNACASGMIGGALMIARYVSAIAS